MSVQPSYSPEVIDDAEYDPFSYPRLYPSGWKLEDTQVKRKTPKQPMPADYNKFPEPNTFPGGWNLED